MTDLLRAEGLSKHFPARDGKGIVQAVADVNLTLKPGETLGIVGESGCGKSTLARLILRLVEPTSGRVIFDGQDLTALQATAMRRMRRNIQIVFQDPYASLDPRMTVSGIIAEPLDIHGVGDASQRRKRVLELLNLVGLPANAASRYPHEFSGGQRQRIGIARAIALEPKLVILDEPVSALDASIQAQVLNLLEGIKRQLNLSYVFISHDLSVIRHVSDRVAVMYLGRIVELGTAEEVLDSPQHPYTQALVAAIPDLDPERRKSRQLLIGDPPNPEAIPAGCPFHPRCSLRMETCLTTPPQFIARGTRMIACHL